MSDDTGPDTTPDQEPEEVDIEVEEVTEEDLDLIVGGADGPATGRFSERLSDE